MIMGDIEILPVTYPAFIIKDFNANISAFRNMPSHIGDTSNLRILIIRTNTGWQDTPEGFTADVLDSHIAGQV